MVTEGMYVVLVEQALFLVGAAGALLMHSEQACVRLDAAGIECLETGPMYFSVMYCVTLLASVAAFVGLASSVVMTALVPGVSRSPSLHAAAAAARRHATHRCAPPSNARASALTCMRARRAPLCVGRGRGAGVPALAVRGGHDIGVDGARDVATARERAPGVLHRDA